MKNHQINEQTRSRLQKLAGINEIKIIKPQGLVAKIPVSIHYDDIEDLVKKSFLQGGIFDFTLKGVDDKLFFEIVPVDTGSGPDVGGLNSGDLAGFFYNNFGQLIDNVLNAYGIEYKQLNVMGEPALRVSVEEMLEKGISFSYNGEILNFSKYKNLKDKYKK